MVSVPKYSAAPCDAGDATTVLTSGPINVKRALRAATVVWGILDRKRPLLHRLLHRARPAR